MEKVSVLRGGPGAWTRGEEEPVAFSLEDGPLWVRAGGVPRDVLDALAGRFGFHPLAVEDTLNPRQRPKVEGYPDITFVVARVPRPDGEWQQAGFFLGDGWLVTASSAPLPELDKVERRLLDRGLPEGRRTASAVLHLALDALVDAWFPYMEELEEAVDGLEEGASQTPSEDLLAEIREVKRLVSRIRKVSGPMREMALSLERGDHKHIDDTTQVYLRDVSDHMVRLAERLEHVKEMALIAQETWNSTLANQQNTVMKRLTVVAGLLLFPSLIAGLGGMNFERGFPGWGYWEVTGGIFAFIVVGFAVAAWKKWL